MMIKDLYYAKIVTTIMQNGICDMLNDDVCESEDYGDNFIEIIAILLAAHRKRYARCFSDEQRVSEKQNLLKNYKAIISEQLRQQLSPELLIAIFDFITCDNLKSKEFREMCVNLVNLMTECKIEEIRNSISIKLIRSIVRGALYGEEPYDTILNTCIGFLPPKFHESDINFMFME